MILKVSNAYNIDINSYMDLVDWINLF